MSMGERERGGVMELAGGHGGELRVCYENNETTAGILFQGEWG